MKKRWILGFIAVIFLVHTGCALFLVGAGAAGGYAISKDEVEGYSDKTKSKVFDAAKTVLLAEGLIQVQDKEAGILEALVGESQVKVTLEQVSVKTVKIRVQGRKVKGLFPDIGLAQDVYGKIYRKIS